MSNVIQFPLQDGIIITEGVDIHTGSPLFLLEYLASGTRTVVGGYNSLLEVAHTTIEWEKDGVHLVDPTRGAA